MSSEIPLPPSWEKLSFQERLAYIDRLQVELERAAAQHGLTVEQIVEAELRLGDIEQDRTRMLPWEVVKEELRARAETRRE